jgi:hypothetical protein
MAKKYGNVDDHNAYSHPRHPCDHTRGGAGGEAPARAAKSRNNDEGDPARAFREHRPPIVRVDLRGHFLNPRLTSYLRERAEGREAGNAASITRANGDSFPSVVWRVRDRLTGDHVTALVSRFQAGERQRDLAVEYGVSRSTVKRLLAQHGARRYRRRSR